MMRKIWLLMICLLTLVLVALPLAGCVTVTPATETAPLTPAPAAQTPPESDAAEPSPSLMPDEPASAPVASGAALSPATGGVAKLSEAEVETLRAEADALFVTPPSEGTEITLEEYKYLVDSLPKAQAPGNTRYVKFLESQYKLEIDKWVKNENNRQCIIEAWRKENGASYKVLERWEFLYLWDEWYNKKDGETDCYIDRYNEYYSDHDTYNWLKSGTEGWPMLPATRDLICSEIVIPNGDGAQYFTFADQTVNGHPCKVFGSAFGADRWRYWYATDLNRALIAMTWNVGGYMEFYYSYDEQHFDADDSFFDPPKNVVFEG